MSTYDRARRDLPLALFEDGAPLFSWRGGIAPVFKAPPQPSSLFGVSVVTSEFVPPGVMVLLGASAVVVRNVGVLGIPMNAEQGWQHIYRAMAGLPL